MLLEWTCQDCGAIEIYDVKFGDAAETIEYWQEELKDWLCTPCHNRHVAERALAEYGLD